MIISKTLNGTEAAIAVEGRLDTTSSPDLEKEIQKYFSKNKRVGIAFLTVNGRESEPIQGIITPWDIISAVD